MRDTIDRGMEELQAKQGREGLPAAPPSATVAPATAVFTQSAPPPETSVGPLLDQQSKDADQAQQETMAQTKQTKQ